MVISDCWQWAYSLPQKVSFFKNQASRIVLPGCALLTQPGAHLTKQIPVLWSRLKRRWTELYSVRRSVPYSLQKGESFSFEELILGLELRDGMQNPETSRRFRAPNLQVESGRSPVKNANENLGLFQVSSTITIHAVTASLQTP